MIFGREMKDDDRGVMIFALIAIVILLLSIAAGVYYANIRLQRQERITDTAGIKEIEVRLDQIENELENALWESGQKAVQDVRSEVMKTDVHYTLNELEFMVGRNTTRIFEDYFEENHEEFPQIGYDRTDIHLHLRPIPKNRRDIEMIPLYMREVRGNESGWREIPGFFRVERTVHVNVQGEEDTFASRKMEIEKDVKTNFFILADRMNEFRLSRVERMTDTMLFAYLHTKIYDAGEDFQGDWFERPFEESFDTAWLSDYNGVSGRFDGETSEKRDGIWEKSDQDHLDGFFRDVGRFQVSDILTKDDVECMARLALLLEQIRVFRSYDEDLLSHVTDHFEIEKKLLLDHLGEGLENKVNLEALIIKLYQEKGTLSDHIHYSGPFLDRSFRSDFLDIVEKDESWKNTSFGILKTLLQGEMLGGDENWRYDDFSNGITPLSSLDEEKSYLRALVSLHSNVMEETFDSFRVEEADELVKDKIGSLETLDWMKDTRVIGEDGVMNITDSILYTTSNLSRSFGFDEEYCPEIGSTFYYIYFVSDWGFEDDIKNKTEAIDRLNEKGIEEVIHGTIRSKLENRTGDLRDEKERGYDEIVEDIRTYNETKWYDGDEDWKDVWDDLNNTKDIVEKLNSDHLFDESKEYNTTETLDHYYEELKEDIGSIEEKIDWMETGGENYTLDILDDQKNFTRTKWRYEAYRYMLDIEEEDGKNSREHILYVDELLKATPSDLTGHYGWGLSNYSVSSDIDIPPKDLEESVGYVALGSFIEDLERNFLGPLSYSNSFKFFRRVNQNIFDLGKSRNQDQEDVSRLEAILFGEGDPFSDEFEDSPDVKIPLEISKNDIHSPELKNIKGSWIDKGYRRTLEEMKNIEEVLISKADELSSEDLSDEPYEKYGSASFYRSANKVLPALAENMESYRRSTALRADKIGYLYDINGKTESLPVINAPLGGLTVQDGRGEENGLYYTFDLDIDTIVDNGVIECHQITHRGTRRYEDDANTSYEWDNPLSKHARSHYNTFLRAEFDTSRLDIKISPRGEYVLSSEKYASAGYKKSYTSQSHTASAELLTPMPVLEERYNPSPTKDIEVNNISIHQNVFNTSDNELELSFEVDHPVNTSFIVDIIKEDNVQSRSARKRKMSNYYSTLDTGKETTSLLKREKISQDDAKNGTINVDISINFGEENLTKKGLAISRLILSIKPEMTMSMMQRKRDLDQEANETIELYSLLPSISTSEVVYFAEKESYIGVFDFSSDIEEEKKGEFDLIKKIPDDSWVIEKNGIPFLVGFEDLPGQRDIIAGRYGPERSQRGMIDPLVMLEERDPYKYSFLQESDFRSILENEFVSLFMSSSGEKNHFYPARILPRMKRNEEGSWNSLHDQLESGGHVIGNWMDLDILSSFRATGPRYLEKENMIGDPGLGVGGYLYYPLDGYRSSERVNYTFDRTRRLGEDLDKISRRREKTDLLIGTGEYIEMIREAGLIDEFASAERSKREDLFLATSKVEKELDRVDELQEKFTDVSKGSIAIGMNILGEELTEETLKWFERNRTDLTRDDEIRSFLSFDDSFLEDLCDEDHSEALTELEDDLNPMNFTEARDLGMRNDEDLEGIEYLQERYEKSTLLSAVGYGVSPAALKDLELSEYEVDTDELLRWIGTLSRSHHFYEFVDGLDQGEYSTIPSLSFAADSENSKLEWMPFGEDGPPLLIDGEIFYYNMSVSDDISQEELEDLIGRSVKDASACFEDFKERGHIIIEVKSDIELGPDEKRDLRSLMEEGAKEHSPGYHRIGSIELRSEGETEVRYIHI